MKYTALQILNWLTKRAYQDYQANPNIEHFTPMRAQKLLYYAQCASLALDNKPLFSDSIYKMPSGPEIENVKMFCVGREIPESPDTRNNVKLINKDTETRDLLENIYHIYGYSSAHDLLKQIKSEAPWQVTPMCGEFNLDNLKEFYQNVFDITD